MNKKITKWINHCCDNIPVNLIGPSIFLMGNMNGDSEIFEKKFKVF